MQKNNEIEFLSDEVYELNSDDSITENENNLYSSPKTGTISSYVTDLAHNIYSELDQIIKTYGNSVGIAITPIVVDLLEKLDILYRKYDENLQQTKENVHIHEIQVLKKSLEKEKMYRLNAETRMFEIEEEIEDYIVQIKKYDKEIIFMNKRLQRNTYMNQSLLHDDQQNDFKEESINKEEIPPNFENKEIKHTETTKLNTSLNKENNTKKKSIFYDIVENKTHWEKLIKKVENPVEDKDETTEKDNEDVEFSFTNETINSLEIIKNDKSENIQFIQYVKKLNTDLIYFQKDYDNIHKNNEYLLSYIDKLHLKLQNTTKQLKSLISDNSKTRSDFTNIKKKVDHYKKLYIKYRDLFIYLHDSVEWNERFGSCNISNRLHPDAYMKTNRPEIKHHSTVYKIFSNFLKKITSTNSKTDVLPRKDSKLSSVFSILDNNPNKRNSVNKNLSQSYKEIKNIDYKNITFEKNPLFIKKINETDFKIYSGTVVDLTNKQTFNQHLTCYATLWLVILGELDTLIKIIDVSNYNNVLITFKISNTNIISISPVYGYDSENDYSSMSQSEYIIKNSDSSNSTKIVDMTFPNSYSSTNMKKYDLSTVWLGSATGTLYVYSAEDSFDELIGSVDLNSPIISINHLKGRVLVCLRNKGIVLFQRNQYTHEWDFTYCRKITFTNSLNQIPIISSSCCVQDFIWIGSENKVYIFNMVNNTINYNFSIEKTDPLDIKGLYYDNDQNVAIIFNNSTLIHIYNYETYELINKIDIIDIYENILIKTTKNSSIKNLLCFKNYIYVGTSNGVLIRLLLNEEIDTKIFSYKHDADVKFIFGIDYTSELKTFVIISGGYGLTRFGNNEIKNIGVNNSYLIVWGDKV